MSIGAKVRCGVPVSAATAATALAVGVAAEPISMSTLSSVTKRRAFLVALVGSVASSRMITLSFWPATSLGHRAIEFLIGMPSAEVGPVSGRLTPMVTSASAGAVISKATAAAIVVFASCFMVSVSRVCRLKSARH